MSCSNTVIIFTHTLHETLAALLYQPVVGRRKLGHHISQSWKPHVVCRPGRFHKLLIKVERADGVGKLAEVHLQQGGDRVNVLQDQSVLGQVWNSVLVKCNSQSLNVGGDPRETVDAVYNAFSFNELGAVFQHFRN